MSLKINIQKDEYNTWNNIYSCVKDKLVKAGMEFMASEVIFSSLFLKMNM